MEKPRIVVFSGPNSTVMNSTPLVTSNKGRIRGERLIPGRRDHLVPQILHEPVKVKIKKYTAHPLEEDAREVYLDDGKEYYEVTLNPEDGPYPLPYVARRNDGSKIGAPFEGKDIEDPSILFGKRQFFYPDAERVFDEIDRAIYGRSENGEAGILSRSADFDFIRALPSGGFTKKGEVLGVDYFPYRPSAKMKVPRASDLARITNTVYSALKSGKYVGAIWTESSATIEETMYWLSLLVDTDLPIAGVASQRTHGQISNDGDRNLVDAVEFILSGKGKGLGAVGIQDQLIYAARDYRKSDARPGNYVATGGAGGILGSMKIGAVKVSYKPSYKHTSSSEVNLSRLPKEMEFKDSANSDETARIRIKNDDGTLRNDCIPRVTIIKYGHYMEEDESEDPEQAVDVIALTTKALEDQKRGSGPKLHGLVFEGITPYATGTRSQMRAIWQAALCGIPVVRTSRGDPGGHVMTDETDLTIEGGNLQATKARLLLIASMLKVGRLPRSRDPRDPTSLERESVIAKLAEFQEIFDTH